MSVTERISELSGGNRKRTFHNIFDFTTTGLTKAVSVPLSRVEYVAAIAIGTPGSVVRAITADIGTLSATGTKALILPPYAGVVTGAKLFVTTTLAAHADNHWTFTMVNKGAAGTGTTAVLAATSANSTDANASPAGFSLTNYVAQALTLTSTAADLVTAASDVLEFTATKAASASNLVGAQLQLLVDVGDPGETLTCNATVSGTVGTPDNRIVGTNGSTTVTVTRKSANPTSALKFALFAIGT